MMLQERILNDITALGYEVFDCPLEDNQALASPDGYIAIRPGLARQERTVALGHEYGHCAIGAFYYLSSPFEIKERAEERARRTAMLRYIPYEELLCALRQGLEKWEIAEQYGVTEGVIEKTYAYYKEVLELAFSED